MQIAIDNLIESTPGVLGGKPCIVGHRISVEHVVTWHLQLGQSIDEIARSYSISPASIHAALAYYYDHQVEMDQKMGADREWVDTQRMATPSRLVRYPNESPRDEK